MAIPSRVRCGQYNVNESQVDDIARGLCEWRSSMSMVVTTDVGMSVCDVKTKAIRKGGEFALELAGTVLEV